MKFQHYVTRTVKTACFFLTIMVSCLLLQQYLLRNVDHNSLRVEGFYQEERDSLDVVFIGASDIYTSFMPGRASFTAAIAFSRFSRQRAEISSVLRGSFFSMSSISFITPNPLRIAQNMPASIAESCSEARASAAL